jgi:dienelactone hydrolase
LVIFSDIFGINSGRRKSVADIFASLHYNVYLPEVLVTPYNEHLGQSIMENIKGQDQAIMSENFEKVRVYLETKGVKQFFAVGFCWGVWEAFKLAVKYDQFIAIAGPHPSLGVEKMIGGDDVKLASEIRCPVFFLPAKNDPANVKAGGEIVGLLEQRFGVHRTGTV